MQHPNEPLAQQWAEDAEASADRLHSSSADLLPDRTTTNDLGD